MRIIRSIILSLNILFLILLSKTSVAQNKYWIKISDELTQLRKNDSLGFQSSWQAFLQEHNANNTYYSNFLDSYVVLLDGNPSQFLSHGEKIKSYTEVKALQHMGKALLKTEFTFALDQIKASYITDILGLTGKQVKIGVIDGGFKDVDKDNAMKHLIENDQVIFFTDYLLKENTNPYYGKWFAHDDHGANVLKLIGGIDPAENLQSGLATNANFYLARTDHGIRENRLEEDYWVMALEKFYDMGVRLVNTSLGYTNTFDKKKENHHISEVDGQSSMITQAAEAAAQKGMLIVISAGNDGNNKKWNVLSLPADAQHVLSVGATDFAEWSKMSYSSIGPKKLGYVKPDISCFSSNGTSYSAPVITGLAACIWEYDSTLSNFEVMNIIKQSGHLANNPNNYIGYGVPDSKRVAAMLTTDITIFDLNRKQVKGKTYDLSIYPDLLKIAYYHKSDSIHVLEEGILRRNNNNESFILNKPKGAQYTTIYYKDHFILELEWVK